MTSTIATLQQLETPSYYQPTEARRNEESESWQVTRGRIHIQVWAPPELKSGVCLSVLHGPEMFLHQGLIWTLKQDP